MKIKHALLSVVMMGAVLGLGTPQVRADDTKKEVLDQRAERLNNLAEKPEMTQGALKEISVETGVPLTEVERMHKNYRSPAGILIACVLADETKRPPQDFLDSRKSGKTWAAMAHDHHVSLDKINDRLARLEKHLSQSQSDLKRDRKRAQ